MSSRSTSETESPTPEADKAGTRKRAPSRRTSKTPRAGPKKPAEASATGRRGRAQRPYATRTAAASATLPAASPAKNKKLASRAAKAVLGRPNRPSPKERTPTTVAAAASRETGRPNAAAHRSRESNVMVDVPSPG